MCIVLLARRDIARTDAFTSGPSGLCIGGSSESSFSESEETATATSLLDVLKAPKLSELNRKRKVLTNRGGKRRKTSSSTSSEPKSVSPQQRVRENAGEHLTVSRGKVVLQCVQRRSKS